MREYWILRCSAKHLRNAAAANCYALMMMLRGGGTALRFRDEHRHPGQPRQRRRWLRTGDRQSLQSARLDDGHGRAPRWRSSSAPRWRSSHCASGRLISGPFNFREVMAPNKKCAGVSVVGGAPYARPINFSMIATRYFAPYLTP